MADLELLRSFVIFSKSKNISEAAQSLRISQPALTLQLRRLQLQFQQPLFSQEGKRKVLTSFGRALMKEVEPWIGRIEGSVRKVEERFSDPSRLVLRVGGRGEILARVVQKIHFPGAIHFVPLPTETALDRLLSHEVDIAISYRRPDLAYIHSKKIFSDTVRWVCHESWLKKQGLTLQEAVQSLEFMSQVPLLAYKAETPFLEQWLEYLGHRDAFDKIRPHRICEDWNAILRLVEQGMGYALVPSSLEPSPEIAQEALPTKAIPEVTFYALYHSDLLKIPAVPEMLNFG